MMSLCVRCLHCEFTKKLIHVCKHPSVSVRPIGLPKTVLCIKVNPNHDCDSYKPKDRFTACQDRILERSIKKS